jgi:hypothetical protein
VVRIEKLGLRERVSFENTPSTRLVNKGMKKVRDGRLRNTTHADASKEKGHKVRAAS